MTTEKNTKKTTTKRTSKKTSAEVSTETILESPPVETVAESTPIETVTETPPVETPTEEKSKSEKGKRTSKKTTAKVADQTPVETPPVETPAETTPAETALENSPAETPAETTPVVAEEKSKSEKGKRTSKKTTTKVADQTSIETPPVETPIETTAIVETVTETTAIVETPTVVESKIDPVTSDNNSTESKIDPVTSDNNSTETPSDQPKAKERIHPIPPPSEEKQYRAIGLIKGLYLPSAEQFTRGILLTSDQSLIDCVLLGKMMSLAKNHLPLEQPHLWVVYPRTRKEDGNLHCQVVGVWEPEKLHPDQNAEFEVNDNYFSLRGEVIYQMRDEEKIVVKIRQKPRKPDERMKFFKVTLRGLAEGKLISHFVEFDLERKGNELWITGSKDIGFAQKKKPFSKKPFKGKGKEGYKKPFPNPGGEKAPRPIITKKPNLE
jgi:hypothetical protein